MGHVDEELLAALAMDDVADLPDAQVVTARSHVAGCERCAADVSALRDTLAVVSASGPEPLVAPPPQIWSAIAAEMAQDPGTGAPANRSAPVAPVVQLADRRRGVVSTWLASVAAALALIVGLGGGWLLAGDPDSDPADTTVVASTRLASLDEQAADRGTAEVRRHDGRVVLHVEAEQLGGPEGIREVWLINVDGTRMVSLGLLASGEAGDFPFPKRLLDEGYRIVDISSEPTDGNPLHSGQSLARGTIES